MPKTLNVLLMPLLVITASLYAGAYMNFLPTIWLNVVLYLPFALLVILILLAWHFNKGRLLLVAVLLTVPLYQLFFSTAGLSSFGHLTITILNLSIVSLIRERGFVNRYAFNRIAFMGMLYSWSVAFDQEWISFPVLSQMVWSLDGLSWSTLLLSLLIFTCLLSSVCYWWRTANALGACVLITQVTLLILFYIVNTQGQASLLLSGCFLIWVFYILIESHQMAYVDDLTKLNSRRALNEKLLALPKRYVVVMADIDHFKKFNDTYGHDMGDIVLSRVAEEFSKVSMGGKSFRYGGEEFTVLFMNKHWTDIENSLEELRESIESMKVQVLNSKKGVYKDVQVTISMGVSESQVNLSPEQIIKRADDALYQAKRNGRNRIELNKNKVERLVKK